MIKDRPGETLGFRGFLRVSLSNLPWACVKSLINRCLHTFHDMTGLIGWSRGCGARLISWLWPGRKMAEATPVRAGEAWCSRGQKPWPISRACNGKVTCNYGWLMLGSYNDLLDYVVGVRRQDSGFQEVWTEGNPIHFRSGHVMWPQVVSRGRWPPHSDTIQRFTERWYCRYFSSLMAVSETSRLVTCIQYWTHQKVKHAVDGRNHAPVDR